MKKQQSCRDAGPTRSECADCDAGPVIQGLEPLAWQIQPKPELLTMSERQTASKNDQGSTGQPATAANDPRQAPRVLVVDDDPGLRLLMLETLANAGFDATGVASGDEAFEKCCEFSPDLVLLDIWLGDGMDGLTALSRIRERWDMPVIMISGHGNIETAVQAVQGGAYDFIEKPLSYDKIVLSVANGLRYARLADENRLLRERSISRDRHP